MLAASRSVFYTLLLLLIILYIFGIAFTQLARNTPNEPEHFSDLTHSMYTLTFYGALLDESKELGDAFEGE